MVWKIAPKTAARGTLDICRHYKSYRGSHTDSQGGIYAAEVVVPANFNIEKAVENIGHITAGTARSLEIWWNHKADVARIIITSQSEMDLKLYKDGFDHMYPNILIEDIDDITPDWFDPLKYNPNEGKIDKKAAAVAHVDNISNIQRSTPIPSTPTSNKGPNNISIIERTASYGHLVRFGEKTPILSKTVDESVEAQTPIQDDAILPPNDDDVIDDDTHTPPDKFSPEDYKIFDIGYAYGHYFTKLTAGLKPHKFMTHMTKSVRSSQYAWIQFVFVKDNAFSPFLQEQLRMMRSNHSKFMADDYISMSDHIFKSNPQPGEHPEKTGDFIKSYNELTAELQNKIVGQHVLLSVRGIVYPNLDNVLKYDSDMDIIATEAVASKFDHITKNIYEFTDFWSGAPPEHMMPVAPQDESLDKKWDLSNEPDGMWASRKWRKARKQAKQLLTKKNNTQWHKYEVERAKIAANWEASRRASHKKQKRKYRYKSPKYIHLNGADMKTAKRQQFQRLHIFRDRLMPDPVGIMKQVTESYVKKKSFGLRYHQRLSPPFLVLDEPDLAHFIHLPQGDAKLRVGRTSDMVRIMPHKKGFNLGYPARADTQSYTISYAEQYIHEGMQPTSDLPHFFGQLTHSDDTHGCTIHPEDLARHTYIIGTTGAGKTTIIRLLCKHLEMANFQDVFNSAFIFVDPKGSDSTAFLKQFERTSYENDAVHYFHPLETNFSINPLELMYDEGDMQAREKAVHDRLEEMDAIMQILFPEISSSFARMKFIFQTAIRWLYNHSDYPTLRDLFDVILVLSSKDSKHDKLKAQIKIAKDDDSKMLADLIERLANLKADDFQPLINRLQTIVLNPAMAKLFCVRKSTINWDEILQKGHQTVFSLSAESLGPSIRPLVQSTLLFLLWNKLKTDPRKSDPVYMKNKPQIIMVMDEFQDMQNMAHLENILAQARSHKFGLVLAHQTTSQLDSDGLERIIGTTNTHFIGKVQGTDSARFAALWEPQQKDKLTDVLANQAPYQWHARLMPGEDDTEQPSPVMFWPVWVPDDIIEDEFIAEFKKRQYQKYGYGEPVDTASSIIYKLEGTEQKWQRQIPTGVRKPTFEEWVVLKALRGHRYNEIATLYEQAAMIERAESRTRGAEIEAAAITSPAVVVTGLVGDEDDVDADKKEEEEVAVRKDSGLKVDVQKEQVISEAQDATEDTLIQDAFSDKPKEPSINVYQDNDSIEQQLSEESSKEITKKIKKSAKTSKGTRAPEPDGRLNLILADLKRILPIRETALKDALSSLGASGLIESSQGTGKSYYYKLTKKAYNTYFLKPPFDDVISSAETAQFVFEYYLRQTDYFVYPAVQGGGKQHPDFIAYDYDKGTAISIEIESEREAVAHAEQVRENLIKWKALGFHACHMWSSNQAMVDTYNSLTKDDYAKAGIKPSSINVYKIDDVNKPHAFRKISS